MRDGEFTTRPNNTFEQTVGSPTLAAAARREVVPDRNDYAD